MNIIKILEIYKDLKRSCIPKCTAPFFLKILWILFLSSEVSAQAYPVPSMAEPVSGAVVVQTGQNPCFRWSPVNDSRFKSYVVTVSLSTNFPSQRWAYDIFSSSTTNLCWNGGSGWVAKGTSTPLVPTSEAMKLGVTYYWRVLATYHDGTTVVGTDVTGIPFTIVRPSPTLTAPANGATIYASSQNPCFSWTLAPNTNFTNYTITLSTTLDFPTTRWAKTVSSYSTMNTCWDNGTGWEAKGFSPPPAPGPLANGVTYYWRVLASYSDGSLTGNTFAGYSFTHRNSSSSSSSIRSSSSIPSSSRSSSSAPSSRASSSNASMGAPYTESIVYEYDALGRLTFVRDSKNGNRDYDYDAAGNRLSVSTGTNSD